MKGNGVGRSLGGVIVSASSALHRARYTRFAMRRELFVAARQRLKIGPIMAYMRTRLSGDLPL